MSGIASSCEWLFNAFNSGKLRLEPGRVIFGDVGIRFKGSPMPELTKFENSVLVRWRDGAEIDLPGPIDPNIRQSRVFSNHATMEFAVGASIRIQDTT
ncbi:hypothetical protein [Planctomicrobium sp. SH664]|uniref:hypothetical protein n=1 Tax=Planctomicrobium sp. SH664 TaxID=3448125 RepID=UPI003F5AF304